MYEYETKTDGVSDSFSENKYDPRSKTLLFAVYFCQGKNS